MATEFSARVREVADAIDAIERDPAPWPALPEEGIETIANSPNGVEVTVRDGRLTSIFLGNTQLRRPDDDAFASLVIGAVNGALDEHEAHAVAAVLESGGIPGGVSALWQAQAYATSTLHMELDAEERT